MAFGTGAVFEIIYGGQETISIMSILPKGTTKGQIREEFSKSGQQGRLQRYGHEWIAIKDGANIIGIFIPDTLMDNFEVNKERWAEEINHLFFPEFLVYFDRNTEDL